MAIFKYFLKYLYNVAIYKTLAAVPASSCDGMWLSRGVQFNKSSFKFAFVPIRVQINFKFIEVYNISF